MLVRRFYDERLAQASYLVACQQSGEAIVVDPARDVTSYVEAARQERVRITHVTETHIHADFVSGTRELVAATGATALLSGEGGTAWQYGFAAADHATLLHDGDVITLGRVQLTVMHTPGHTPEHIVFIVTDTARSDMPVAMLSGDFLFVGDVGRPDLLEVAAGIPQSKEQSARDLLRSLRRMAALPDYLQVWPGHGAGSACGKALGALPTTTLGYERGTNWAFQIDNEAAFVAAALDGQPTPPTYFSRMKRINRDGPVVLGSVPVLPPIPAHVLPAALRDGIVVDLRARFAFATSHVHGTLNIPLIRAFTTWAGWLLPDDRDLYLISPDADAAADARRALASIGLDRVAGWFDADVVAAAAASGTARISRRGRIADAPALQRNGTLVVDVRDRSEWDAGHVEGAAHHPLGTLGTTLAETDRNQPIAVHCGSGTRSAIAASLLEQLGFSDVTDLADGWEAWRSSARGVPEP